MVDIVTEFARVLGLFEIPLRILWNSSTYVYVECSTCLFGKYTPLSNACRLTRMKLIVYFMPLSLSLNDENTISMLSSTSLQNTCAPPGLSRTHMLCLAYCQKMKGMKSLGQTRHTCMYHAYLHACCTCVYNGKKRPPSVLTGIYGYLGHNRLHPSSNHILILITLVLK